MDPVPAPRHPGSRIVAGLCIALAATLAPPGCQKSAPQAQPAPKRFITVFAAAELEPVLRAVEGVARERDLDWQLNLQLGGAQSLAWSIEAGEIPDLYIASTVEMATDLIPMPISVTPWLEDSMVVISRKDDPDPILRSDRALERSTGPVGVCGHGAPLGEFTRLALRLAEIWPLVERRTTQRTDAAALIDALMAGEIDLAIVFASDVASSEAPVRINQRFELPEAVGIVYTFAPYTDDGYKVIRLLTEPGPMASAIEAGFTRVPGFDDVPEPAP